MKSYTDIEQSRKLAEILPIESADMYYQYVLPKSDKIKHNPEIGNPIESLEWYNKGYTLSGKEPLTLEEYCIPCWSLAALLNVLPKNIKSPFGEVNPFVGQVDIKDYRCVYLDGDWDSNIQTFASNPVDACYEMILELHEQNLI